MRATPAVSSVDAEPDDQGEQVVAPARGDAEGVARSLSHENIHAHTFFRSPSEKVDDALSIRRARGERQR